MNDFNAKRFLYLLRWSLTVDRPYYRRNGLMVAAVMSLMFVLLMNMRGQRHEETCCISAVAMLLSVIVMGGCYMYYRNGNEKQQIRSLLVLPASPLEKFLSCYSTWIFMLPLMVASLVVADVLQNIVGLLLPWREPLWLMPKVAAFFLHPRAALGAAFPLLCVLGVWVHTFFLLGVNVVRNAKYGFLLTAAPLLLLVMLGAAVLPDELLSLLFSTDDVESLARQAHVKEAAQLLSVGLLLLSVVQVWVAFRLFCRRQIVGNLLSLRRLKTSDVRVPVFGRHRFSYLCSWCLHELRGNLLVWTLSSAAGVLLFELFFVFVLGLQNRAYYVLAVRASASLLAFFLVIALTISSANTFGWLSRRQRRETFLTLPVTNRERWWASVFVSTVLWPAAIAVSFVLGDAVRMAVFGMLGYGWLSGIPQLVAELQLSSLVLHWRYAAIPIFVFSATLWIHSTYVLGSALLRRYAFVVVSSVLFFLGLAAGWFFVHTDFDIVFVSMGSMSGGQSYVHPILYVLIVLLLVFAVYNYRVSYRTFCRFEIVDQHWIRL